MPPRRNLWTIWEYTLPEYNVEDSSANTIELPTRDVTFSSPSSWHQDMNDFKTILGNVLTTVAHCLPSDSGLGTLPCLYILISISIIVVKHDHACQGVELDQ